MTGRLEVDDRLAALRCYDLQRTLAAKRKQQGPREPHPLTWQGPHEHAPREHARVLAAAG